MKQPTIRGQLLQELEKLRNENSVLRKTVTKNKRLLKECQKFEERWRYLIKHFKDRVLIINREGTIVYINRTFPESSVEDVIGTKLTDSAPLEERSKVTGILGIVFDEGKSQIYDSYYERKNGERVYFEIHILPILSKATVTEAVLLATNITERVNAETALRESEEKFRTLAEESPNMIFINKKDRIVYVNPRCEEIMGYTQEELLAPDFDFRSLIVPEYLDSIAENLARHWRRENVPPEEYALITKAGKRIEYILTTKLIPYENESALLGIVTDITHRKKAEKELKKNFDSLEQKVTRRTRDLSSSNLKLMYEIEERKRIEAALRKSEEKLRGILESSPDAITMTDANAIIVECNQATLDLHGFSSKEEMIGMEAYALIAPQDRNKAAKNLTRTLKYGVIMNVEYSFLKKDGSEFPGELSASVIKDSAGKMVGFVAVIKDISERKRAEYALITSKSLLKVRTEELEEKNIALREIIAQIEMEKRRMHEDIMTNVGVVVAPILENLSQHTESKIYVDLLKHHLDRLTSSFGSRITDTTAGLTPREIEISNMIKGGLSSKDICKLLNISLTTVERHRKNIRKKLRITNKNVNLAGYLQQL